MTRLGLVAGAIGISGFGAQQARAARGTTVPRVIHGADWRVVWPGVQPGTHPPVGSPRLPHGRLVDGHGTGIGTFGASVMPSSAGATQLHTLELTDGTITAVGPATFDDATYAVVGGTGRYSGVSGSYHLVQRPAASGGTATFTLDITTPEV
jgi:hypothetical protein